VGPAFLRCRRQNDSEIVIDLAKLGRTWRVPIPRPGQPVREVKDLKVNQVLIGSCTNSSYQDMMRVAIS
jgi:aconitate hydratase